MAIRPQTFYTRDLQAGHRLMNDDGTWAEVVSVVPLQRPLATYNLTVDEFETYFVAANYNAAPVWVHNCKGQSNVQTANGQKASKDGTSLGGSGKAKFHNKEYSTRKAAIDGAKNDKNGSGRIVTDKANKKQAKHYHSIKKNGKRATGSNKTHHLKRGDKKKQEDKDDDNEN